MNDIAYIQQKLDVSKKNTDRWRQAVDGDVRPGNHYRKEIVLLKQEIDKKDDDIRDREITIENLMAGNHPSHAYLFEESQQTSICSSILDESGDNPQARELERLLSEHAECAHKLRMQEEENNRLRGIMADREKEHIAMKHKIATYEKNNSRSAQFDPFQMTDGQRSLKCDAVSACNLSDRSESIRTTKRVMELHNELNKVIKERNSYRHELEVCQSEAMLLRKQLTDAKSNSRNELVSKLNEVKIALYNSGPKEVSFASTIANSDQEVGQSSQNSEIAELRKALEDSLAELEMAAEVTMEQRRTIQELKSASKAKEADYLKLQQSLQVESESLEITKSYLRKKDSEIEQLERNVKKLESSEKAILFKDNEINDLKQTMTFWKDRYADLQKEMAEKEIEIDRLKISALEIRDNVDEESKDEGSHLFRGLKEENELLTSKTRHQTIQLQKADKILFEKELEKSKLKTLLREMQSQLDSGNMGESQANYNALRDHNLEFIDSLSSESGEKKDDDTVLLLQNRIETLTTQANDQQFEMDILVKNYAQLGVSHRELEDKSKSFESDAKFFTDEILKLYNDLEQNKCEMQPLNIFIEILLNRKPGDISSAALEKLECTRFELVDRLKNITQERNEFNKEITSLQQDMEQQGNELAKFLSAETGPSETDLLLDAERNEKEEITRQRNIIFLKLKATREDLKEIQEKKARLEKTLMSQASTLQSLSHEVEEKDAKIARLGKGAAINNTLMSENADLREKNASHAEKVNILHLEIEELKQELSFYSRTNESVSTLKMQLEGAKTAGNNLAQTYEGRIADLTTSKDATINALRKELNTSESQSAEKIAHLKDQLTKLREANNEMDSRLLKIKDERISALEQTLHVQEETVETLRSDLRQAQAKIEYPSEQHRKELEKLEQELMESKYIALSKDRECLLLKDKLDKCKIEHQTETEYLEKEIERLNNDESSLSGSENDHEEQANMMIAAKQRLEQLKVVNTELKEDNEKLGSRLEQALAKIQSIEDGAKRDVFKMETECATLKKKVADLEGVLDKIGSATKRKSKLTVVKTVYQQGKGKKDEKSTKSKVRGWGKKSSGEF